MKQVLVTGDRGFTGLHLTSHLRSEGFEVAGFGRSNGGDIRDRTAVRAATQSIRPDMVFHLAAAPKSAGPDELYSINVLGTVALLDALLELNVPPVVVLVSSSAVYGQTAGRPVTERSQPRPVTPYGAGKLAAEDVAMRYVRAHGLRVIRVRPFNLLGPGLPTELACGAFAAAVARLERLGTAEPLRTGNLKSSRDFTDVRDAVRAYVLLAERGRAGSVYNVCSGKAVSLDHCLHVLLGLAAKPIATELDPGRLQVNDVTAQVGDSNRLRALTNWKPRISIEQSLADMLDHERRERGDEGNRSRGRKGHPPRALHDGLS
jgi:GDP-4-dehydro-6-deoxy-D-mannose reductase